MGEHPATILQPNVTKLGGIRTHEARRAGTRTAERPNKQGLLWIRTNRGGWLQANYKTAALPLSYAGICCAFNGLQIAALEHSDNLGRKLAQSLNAQTFRHQADWLGC